jgi:probable HAF family extracellular repeat protein
MSQCLSISRRPLGLERLEDRCLLSYTLTELGALAGGSFSQGFGLNNRGFVAGIGDIPNPNVDRAFLYTPKTGMLDLGSLNGGASEGFAINGRKEVTGFADVPSAFHAFLASPRRGMKDLGTLGGDLSVGYGINDRAQVAGWSNLTVGVTTHHAFLVDKTGMYDLGTLGGDTSEAWAVNNAGQVAGFAFTASGAYHAFLDTAGTMLDLGTLGGTTSAAYGVNDQGQVTGTAQVGTGSHAFLYSNGAMEDLGTLGGSLSTGYGLNNLGQVVGSSQFGGMASHAFIYSDGQMVDLNSLIPPGVTLSDARAINDAGQILANGQDNTTRQLHAYLLIPADTSQPGDRLESVSPAVEGLVPIGGLPSRVLTSEEFGTPYRTWDEQPLVSHEARSDLSFSRTQQDGSLAPALANDDQPADGLADPLAG